VDERRGHEALLAHKGDRDAVHAAPPPPAMGNAEINRTTDRLGRERHLTNTEM
jgi:hypothetical protein